MLRAFLFSLYFSCLFGFSLVTHPVIYCILLLLSAIRVSGLVYLSVGFSWYLILFCLVYIGGVYVLFIFVSIHNPNPRRRFGRSLFSLSAVFGVMLVLFVRSLPSLPGIFESSYYLCSYFEGFSYCLFCLVLMVGFVSISVVVGGKDSFFR